MSSVLSNADNQFQRLVSLKSVTDKEAQDEGYSTRNDDSQNAPNHSARRQAGHEFAEVARSLAKPPVVVRRIRVSMLILIWIGVTAGSLFVVRTGFQQVVTQTGVTAKRGDPTPIPLTGTVAVINGVCLLIIGGLVFALCLLPIRILWKRYASRTAATRDERNS